MKSTLLNFITFLLEKLIPFGSSRQGTKKEETNTDSNYYDVSCFKRGDLLEVSRTLFVHFGIYLGDNRVAHLMPDILPAISRDKSWIHTVVTNKRLIMGVLAKVASIRVDTVEDFAYGASIVVNQMDRKFTVKPLSNEEVATRAEKLVGSIEYSLLWNNCEHFVTYCRYDSLVSFQTDKVDEDLRFCQAHSACKKNPPMSIP
ncbi:lecithin retinol acyltransferase-like [Lissotriton helveticus]